MNNMQQGGFTIGGQPQQQTAQGAMPWRQGQVAHPGADQSQPQYQQPAQAAYQQPVQQPQQFQQPVQAVYQQPTQQPAFGGQPQQFQQPAAQPQQFQQPAFGGQAQQPAGFQQQMQAPVNAMLPQNNQPAPGRMLTGAAAAAAMASKPGNSSGEYGFSLKVGEMKSITFLDGHLDQDGMFAVGFANEHVVKFGPKSYESYQCLQDYGQQCPCCDQSRDVKNGPVGFQSLRGFFTVIDHDGYTTKEGAQVPHARRLYKASRKTIQQLAILVKTLGDRDGHYSLAGRCFQVSRTGDKAASVGDVLIPIDKYPVDQMLQQLKATYPDRADSFALCDYTTVLKTIDASQMFQMFQRLGSGGGNQPLGHSTGIAGNGMAFGQAPVAQPQQPAFGAQPQQQAFGAQPQQPAFGAQPTQQPAFGGQPQQFQQPVAQPQQFQQPAPQQFQQQPQFQAQPQQFQQQAQQPQQPVFGAGLQPPGSQPQQGAHGYPDLSGQI